MWDKARSLAAKHLKPAFDNLRIVSTENQETQTPEVLGAPVEEAPRLGPADELASVTAERDQLQAETAELQDRLLRRQAEFENYRRRVERDRSDFLQYAGMEVVRDILPVLDDFERALKVESSDAGYRKGVELIFQRLEETLKKIGLEPIETQAGQEFDPNLHQAVVRFETDEAPDHTILEEFQRGYNFKGKLLRPAMVKVAVNPAA
jgi:molecular chaperone GrpE